MGRKFMCSNSIKYSIIGKGVALSVTQFPLTFVCKRKNLAAFNWKSKCVL